VTTDRVLIGAGALLMALAVALGAYSAHAAREAAHPEAQRLLQTAVLYQMVHALGVLAAGVVARGGTSAWLLAAATLHVVGIALFCGSLWILALTARSMGPAAPLGGLCFIAGWIALVAHALFAR
jgi:uncharacterized membrane protein YgdD (TMEM256/DUF423 family)